MKLFVTSSFLPNACIVNYMIMELPVETNPNCLHTTTASLVSQELSQTVPHTLLLQISTRPSVIAVPPTSRKAPLVVELHVWAAKQKGVMNTYYFTQYSQHCKVAMNGINAASVCIVTVTPTMV